MKSLFTFTNCFSMFIFTLSTRLYLRGILSLMQLVSFQPFGSATWSMPINYLHKTCLVEYWFRPLLLRHLITEVAEPSRMEFLINLVFPQLIKVKLDGTNWECGSIGKEFSILYKCEVYLKIPRGVRKGFSVEFCRIMAESSNFRARKISIGTLNIW